MQPRLWVQQYIGAILGVPAGLIALDRPIGAHGLDSVAAVTMAGEFECAFGVPVDSGVFLQHGTLAAAIAVLEALVAARPVAAPAR